MIATLFLSYVGALIRWIIGTIWHIVSQQKLYSFQKYLYGPKDFENLYDTKTPNAYNFFLGIVVITFIGIFLSKKLV